MKRVVVLLLALSMLFALAACSGKTTCDICGETKSCETIDVMGEKMNICSDCKQDAMDIVDMLGDVDLSDLDLSGLDLG